jgi:hypothetical protein
MRVLYRDFFDQTLVVAEVNNTTYFPDEEVLHFSGDVEFGISADKATAEKLVRSLYLEGKVDVSGYDPCDVDELLDEEFEDDDEDFEDLDFDEEEDVLRFILPDEEKNSFGLPKTIRFPKKSE